MATSPDEPRVLIVDDEESVADLYQHHLSDRYDILKAYGGVAAVETIDETVDVVLLDRRMPSLSGDEVLKRIRSSEYDCRIVMVTAVDPKVDIVDMPFDDYLNKPVDKEILVETVDHQLTVMEYVDVFQELEQLRSKIDVMKTEKSTNELDGIQEYQDMKERISYLRDREQELVGELDYFEATAARQ